MIRALRAVPLLFASLALLAPVASAGAAEGTISYEKESEAAFRGQMAHREIAEAVVNKHIRTLRLTLKDGRHVLARYPAHTEPRVVHELKARGAKVSVLSKSAAEAQAKKIPVHHKIRYIVGGVVIALVVIGTAAVLVRRRRLAY